MNYDTVLPDRLRAELKRKVSRKPLKLFYKIAIALLLFAGLRHLNTVPYREWKFDYYTGSPNGLYDPALQHKELIYTSEELFGSSYHGSIDGEDIGIHSQVFADVRRRFNH